MSAIKKLLVSFVLMCATLAAPMTAFAGEILFAMVNTVGSSYVHDGLAIRDMLVGTGYNVTTRDLNAGVYNDYNSFDQIFVYDLSPYDDNSATQLANYQGIASWYNGRATSEQNLILDGRIISSSPNWTNYSNGLGSNGEPEFIQNYRDQLNVRGGGLVLGTDHATAFTRGINYINQMIDVSEFTGYYHQFPYEAYVDPNSPLYVPELEACTLDPGQQCINDNSSTSFVATGLQANGQVLTPVAYHGGISGAFQYAAVSTTMGSITFGTCGGVGQPACTVPEPSPLFLLGISLLGLRFASKIRVQRS